MMKISTNKAQSGNFFALNATKSGAPIQREKKLIPLKNGALKGSSEKMTKREDKKLKESCRDFEAVLLNQLMSEMRKTVKKTDLFGDDNFASDTYSSMFDTELSNSIAQTGGFGIADKLYNQLGNSQILPNLSERGEAKLSAQKILSGSGYVKGVK